MSLCQWIHSLNAWIKNQTHKDQYPLLIGAIALADHFVFFFPVDALLVGSSLMAPRRKFLFSLTVALGSAVGASILGGAVLRYGDPLVQNLWPEMTSYALWGEFENFLNSKGFLGLTLIAASPFALQPAIILAGLAEMNSSSIFLASFVGRLLKSLCLCYLIPHRP